MYSKEKQIRRRAQKQRRLKKKSKLIEKAYAAPWVYWKDVNKRNSRKNKK